MGHVFCRSVAIHFMPDPGHRWDTATAQAPRQAEFSAARQAVLLKRGETRPPVERSRVHHGPIDVWV